MNMNINYAAQQQQQQQQQYPPKQINPSLQSPANQQHLNGNYQQNLSTGMEEMNLNQNNQKLNSQLPLLPPTNQMNNFNANSVQPQNFPQTSIPQQHNFSNQLPNRNIGQPPTSIGQQLPVNALNPSTNLTNQAMPSVMSPMMAPVMSEAQHRPQLSMTPSATVSPNLGPPPTSNIQPTMVPTIQSNMGRTSVPPTAMGSHPQMTQTPSSLTQSQMVSNPQMSMIQPQTNQPPNTMGQPGIGLSNTVQSSFGPGPTSKVQGTAPPLHSMNQSLNSFPQPSGLNINHLNMSPMTQPPRPLSNLPQQNFMGQPPNAMIQPPNAIGQPPNMMSQPPNTMNQPPNAMGQPPNTMVQPPNMMSQPQTAMGQPLNSMAQPPNMMSQPSSLGGQPPNMMSQPPNLMGQSPNLMGQLPNTMGQLPNKMGQPPNMMGQTPNMMSQPPNMMAQPPNKIGQPQNTQLKNQPPTAYPGQLKTVPAGPMYPQQNTMPPHLSGPQSTNQFNYSNAPNDNMHQYQQQQPINYPPQGPPTHLNQNNMMYSQGPAPPRKLDPDQMPNPIQVLVENQKTAGGPFATNQAGLLPPLVTTKYVTQDQGNSNPRFVRSSMYTIPLTPELLKTTAVPFSLIISPMAKTVDGELPPPIVNFGELGPIRCIRCKAYMSPNMQFIDAGRRFQCLLCKAITEVPTEYFQHLDHTGQRVDKYERPELVLGTYEFIATKDYCRDSTFPNPPAFIFIIDVSYNNIKSGLVELLCNEIKEILNNLPIDQGFDKSKAQVGFITYNNVVHFYNVKNSLTQPQMMIVGDLQEMFMPLLDGFLCTPDESLLVIDALMKQIPVMFSQTKETETILLPAIQAGIEALKASKCSGKLLVFNSSLPVGEAPGKLRNRDDRKLLGTEKEKQILLPQSQAYEELGKEAVQIGASVDLFIFNNSYIDLATIGQVSKLTGGEIYKYTYFQAEIDGHRLKQDLITNISKPIAFDAVMRVRTSAGVRPTDFYGHFYMSNTTDLELASIDSDKSIAIEIKHDDKLTPDENLYIQIALLYTSCSGQRRLRIMNLALKTTNIIADIFKTCDVDVITLFYAKQAMIKLLELTPRQVKDNIIHRSSQILACYRKHCTSPTSAGQLILPECMKLLPLYVSCLLKNDSISGGSDMTCDDRSYIMQYVLSLDLPTAVIYFYPRLIQIYPLDLENDEHLDLDVPIPIRCSYEKMNENGAFILENGIYLFVWLGKGLPANFLLDCFGVQHTQQVNTERFYIKDDTEIGKEINDIIANTLSQRKKCMKIVLLKQEDKLENIYRHFLVEDRGSDGTSGYVDFLCHMHKEIKDLLH